MEQNYMEKDYIEEVFEDLFFNSAIEREFLSEDYIIEKAKYDNMYKKLNEKLQEGDRVILNSLKEIQNELICLRLKECYDRALRDSIKILKHLKVI
ncbi:hypothetical protein phiCT9441A_66 (endogenous virus) [Clostridium phage phiCTC2B]|uniref:hypothetical protein n=1 Tax=Clostridium phage phiCT453B TaxID=1567013 RepID=UPI0002F129BC|nr:hypothetical protein [Clostridium tetani]YP_009217957.1 hypothetical protein phiCT453B_61 [Clostridium phage phiCT453B]YP_009276963.1 hypothetical protein phiCT9441A_66 [Clostridium phage phiCT19406B]YP_009277407.1 hypothetical protein phiCT9441A_66 [Clostridium phage phiCTC2B]AJA42613.1 hypothetical protein phiCT453B_61 [Clostridium phage phiCT453B]AJA42823.1 hypothetical protein phiCT9441A_66 [Clostridium phage phiCT19406B]AJA43019.1 hypothetical protein phiCT9441A_66 [Clostridium phage 